MVITFDNSESAVCAHEVLKTAAYEDKKLLGKQNVAKLHENLCIHL